MQRNAEKYYEILNSKVVTLHLASLNSAESFTNCRLSSLYPFQFAIAQWLRKRPSQPQWIHDQFACARKHNHMSLTQDLWRRLDAQRNLPLWSIVSVCQQHNNSNPPENDLIWDNIFWKKYHLHRKMKVAAMAWPWWHLVVKVPRDHRGSWLSRTVGTWNRFERCNRNVCCQKKKKRNRLWSEIISLYIMNTS